jgi:2,5-diketo-D-gluconate reductase B
MHMPQPGLGTFGLQGRQAIDSVRNRLGLGYRHIDTAQVYANEAEVGAALAGANVPRGEVFVTRLVSPDFAPAWN